MDGFILKGQIFYSTGRTVCQSLEDGYLVCTNGICRGAFPEIPQAFKALPVIDFGRKLIVPGLVDLHLHAPQSTFRGLGMDLELMDWLNTHTFPEESKYADLAYAEKAYSLFADSMKDSFTTRAVVFATAHTEATWLLMDKLEKTGLITYVGRVNMDANGTDTLQEPSAAYSMSETRRWLNKLEGYQRTMPILTPRFVPSCSAPLLEALGQLAAEKKLPVQSHLSENLGEISFVQELFPDSAYYGQVYDRFGLMSAPGGCIMAHCVHSGEEELALMKKRGVYIAHSPESNMNLSSGVAPVKRYLDLGLNVGLASDVAAGSTLDLFRAMSYAIQVSKLRWRLQDQSVAPLTFEEAFYLATLGGGSFFGKVGSFQDGFEFDALVLDDSGIPTALDLTIEERVARLAYLSDRSCLSAKFVAGKRLD